MTNAIKFLDSTTERLNQLKPNKRFVFILSAIILLLIISSYLYSRQLSFSANHKLMGEDENRVFVIEITAPKGSMVTIVKTGLYPIEAVAPSGSIVFINKTETLPVDQNGITQFKVFPGELKIGLNKIKFEVKMPFGLKKSFYYSIEKSPMPVALKVEVEDQTVNNENIKNISVVTDPLNTVSIDGLINNIYLKTGQDDFKIKSYDILKLAGKDLEGLPDVIEIEISVIAVNVDGQEKTIIIPVKIPTYTNLNIDSPEETDQNNTIITGKASPGTNIIAAGQTTVSDISGIFKLSISLPNIGENIITVLASRPGEKASSEEVAIVRLMPKVDLSVDKPPAIANHNLTIKGTTLPGATVTVNGQPALMNGNRFNWSFQFPLEASKDYLFIIKADKPGYRSNEEIITVDKMPVFRKTPGEG